MINKIIQINAPDFDSNLISVLILTFNESIHIERSIRSAQKLTSNIFVVDSFSTDNTVSIAESLGAKVYTREFINFASKLNWCLDNIKFPTPWIARLDADEIFSDDFLVNFTKSIQNTNPDITGIYVKRQLWFMGKWIKHGGMYPTYSMRLWRNGTAHSEVRDLDEHMILSVGKSMHLDLDIIDNPLSNIANWITKHNGYSALEAKSTLIDQNTALELIKPNLFGNKIERTRWMKVHIFYRLPLFVRPIIYYIYRYIFKLGFLDGKEGFLFHFLHGLWYRILVDAKIYEQRKKI